MGIRKLLLGQTPPHLEPDDPQPGESTIASAAACTIKRGVAWVGGDLIVTNQRLIFNPWSNSDLTKLTSQGLKFVPTPRAHHMTVVGSAQRLGTQADADSGLITAVSVGRPAGPARPPTIVVERSNGAPLEFGIARSRWTPTRSHRNIVVRDRIWRPRKPRWAAEPRRWRRNGTKGCVITPTTTRNGKSVESMSMSRGSVQVPTRKTGGRDYGGTPEPSQATHASPLSASPQRTLGPYVPAGLH